MRQIINLNQTTSLNRQEFEGKIYHFQKGLGCIFSDNEAMDSVVNYFLNKDGFELKSAKKTETKKESTKKEKKSFFKKDKVEEEKVEEVVEKVAETEEE